MTCKSIFTAAGLPNAAKSTRNTILQNVASVKSPLKQPPLTPRHQSLRVEWVRNYLKIPMKYILFTDETRATLDGPDGWANDWLYFGDERHQWLRRQQRGGGVMIWAGIIGDRLIGPVRVLEGVKVTSAVYCNLLTLSLVPWIDHIPLSLFWDFIFMDDNAPSHSVGATKEFLANLVIKDDNVILWRTWPPSSLDLKPIENFWSIIKRDIYSDGRQFSSKNTLWQAIYTAARAVPGDSIKKMTDVMNSRLFKVIKGHGRHVGN